MILTSLNILYHLASYVWKSAQKIVSRPKPESDLNLIDFRHYEVANSPDFQAGSAFKDNNIYFNPPVYVQRYLVAADLIKNYITRYAYPVKVVDFGCAEVSFFEYLKRIDGIKEVLCIDVDEQLLQENHHRAKPLLYHHIVPKEHEFRVDILAGSIIDCDSCLLETDILISIEMIEHLYPHELNALPWTIFGFMQPKLAAFTTPNFEFNVLFKNLDGFRHNDHKFEWTRQQFHDWAENIVSQYPNYDVHFSGIGPGPAGTEHLGCVSQMAVFIQRECYREDFSSDINEYKLVASYKYPVKDDMRSTEDKMMDAVKHQCIRLSNMEPYVNQRVKKFELKYLFKYVTDYVSSIDQLRCVLYAYSKVIKCNKNGDDCLLESGAEDYSDDEYEEEPDERDDTYSDYYEGWGQYRNSSGCSTPDWGVTPSSYPHEVEECGWNLKTEESSFPPEVTEVNENHNTEEFSFPPEETEINENHETEEFSFPPKETEINENYKTEEFYFSPEETEINENHKTEEFYFSPEVTEKNEYHRTENDKTEEVTQNLYLNTSSKSPAGAPEAKKRKANVDAFVFNTFVSCEKKVGVKPINSTKVQINTGKDKFSKVTNSVYPILPLDDEILLENLKNSIEQKKNDIFHKSRSDGKTDKENSCNAVWVITDEIKNSKRKRRKYKKKDKSFNPPGTRKSQENGVQNSNRVNISNENGVDLKEVLNSLPNETESSESPIKGNGNFLNQDSKLKEKISVSPVTTAHEEVNNIPYKISENSDALPEVNSCNPKSKPLKIVNKMNTLKNYRRINNKNNYSNSNADISANGKSEAKLKSTNLNCESSPKNYSCDESTSPSSPEPTSESVPAQPVVEKDPNSVYSPSQDCKLNGNISEEQYSPISHAQTNDCEKSLTIRSSRVEGGRNRSKKVSRNRSQSSKSSIKYDRNDLKKLLSSSDERIIVNDLVSSFNRTATQDNAVHNFDESRHTRSPTLNNSNSSSKNPFLVSILKSCDETSNEGSINTQAANSTEVNSSDCEVANVNSTPIVNEVLNNSTALPTDTSHLSETQQKTALNGLMLKNKLLEGCDKTNVVDLNVKATILTESGI